MERNKQLYVKLYPEVSTATREQPPIASFVIKLVSSASPNRKTLVHPGRITLLLFVPLEVIQGPDLVSTDTFIRYIRSLFIDQLWPDSMILFVSSEKKTAMLISSSIDR